MVLGPKGALSTWLDGGYVTLGLDGQPSGAVHDEPDLLGDGAGSILQNACARPDGRYALIAATNAPSATTHAVSAIVDADGAVVESHDLGTLMIDGNNGDAWVACDGSGRAHFLWNDTGEVARYTTLGAPP